MENQWETWDNASFVRFCMERYYQETLEESEQSLYLPAKAPTDDPLDGGVPARMQAGPEQDGWVRWQLLPSEVTEEDLNQLERELGVSFPPLFRGFLSTYYHFFGAITGGRVPDQSSDCPLSDLREVWHPDLTRNQYLPFESSELLGAYLCLDVSHLPQEEKCPVVSFPLDEVYGLDENAITRAQLEAIAQPVSPNFKTYLAEVFLKGGACGDLA